MSQIQLKALSVQPPGPLLALVCVNGPVADYFSAVSWGLP